MEPKEHRKEKRYPTNDEGRIFMMPLREEQAVKILNVSKSGVQLKIATPLPPQATIEILAADGVAIFGEVRYCRAVGSVYQAGVYIHDTILTLRPEHIREDSLSLHVKGRGLAVHELLRIEAHLERCAQCRTALVELTEVQLDRLRMEKNLLDEAISSLEKYAAKFKPQI